MPVSYDQAIATVALLRGDFERASNTLVQSPPSSTTSGLRGWLLFLRRDYDAAHLEFQQGLTLLRKEARRRKVFYLGVLGIYALWTLLLRDQPGDLAELKTHVAVLDKLDEDDFFVPIKQMLAIKQGEPSANQLLKRALTTLHQYESEPLWAQYQYLLAATRLCSGDTLSPLAKTARRLHKTASANGYAYLAAELAAIVAALQPASKAMRDEADGFQDRSGIVLVQRHLQREEPWERALYALSRLVTTGTAPTEAKEARLIWCLQRQPTTRVGYLLELPDDLNAETDATGNAGEKHLRILAALTKLRRACCHSALVMPEADWPSSKLSLFGDILTELLENKHKVLVCSQFIDYLALIRACLDERQVSYQYLDGQTPALERKQRVDAFQSGQGDVFLISLKAGGTGLNLTVADYVIHMDRGGTRPSKTRRPIARTA